MPIGTETVAAKAAVKLIPIALNTISNLATNAAQNKANKKQAEYQYSTAQEQWNLANLYNDPKNQMIRLAEAGLNPNLVYGSNAVTGNTTSPAESYKAAKQEFNAPQVLQQYQDFQLKEAQTDNIKTNSENIRLKNITEGLNQSKIALETSKNQLDYDIAQTLKDFTINKGISEAAKAENEDISSSWDWALKMNQLKQSEFDLDKSNIENKIKALDLDYMQRGMPTSGSGPVGDIARLLLRTGQRYELIK